MSWLTPAMVGVAVCVTICAIVVGWWRFMDFIERANVEQMKDDIIDLRVSANDLRVRAGRAYSGFERDELIAQAADLETRAAALHKKVFHNG